MNLLLKNISPRYELEILFCSKREWGQLSKERKEEIYWIDSDTPKFEQVAQIAAKIFTDILEIYPNPESSEGRSKVLDNLMKHVLKNMNINIMPKLHGQVYEFYNMSPEFQLRIEFNTREVFKARGDGKFRGQCRMSGGGNSFDSPLKLEMEISLTDLEGEFYSPTRMVQTLSHELSHTVYDDIGRDYQFIKIRKKNKPFFRVEVETLSVIYENLLAHILSHCFVWE